MATLPDPTDELTGDYRALYDRMAARRAGVEGRDALAEVYVRMFNNPGVAGAVGALGAHLRFGGVLPGDVREVVILRSAYRQGFGYEWSHHVLAAQQAGLTDEQIGSLAADEVPAGLGDPLRAVVEAVDLVVAKRSIPADVQDRIVAALGTAGVVEVVALCGIYALMGYTVTAFDIPTEDGFPPAPF